MVRTTIVTSDCTIVTSGHHISTRTFISNNSITYKNYNRKYTWLHILLLPPWWVFYLRYWELTQGLTNMKHFSDRKDDKRALTFVFFVVIVSYKFILFSSIQQHTHIIYRVQFYNVWMALHIILQAQRCTCQNICSFYFL